MRVLVAFVVVFAVAVMVTPWIDVPARSSTTITMRTRHHKKIAGHASSGLLHPRDDFAATRMS